MLTRVITGGQTGADQAGWRAARSRGIVSGGRMPRGFLTEEGPRPEFAALYGAIEGDSPEYDGRTIDNVRDADGSLILAGERPGPGTRLTVEACRSAGVPFLVLDLGRLDAVGMTPTRVAAWIGSNGIRTLNVAGDRESTSPGIGARVEAFLREVFRELDVAGPFDLR